MKQDSIATEKGLIFICWISKPQNATTMNISKNLHSHLKNYFKKFKLFHLFLYFHNAVQLPKGKAEICKAFLQNPLLLPIPYYKKKEKKRKIKMFKRTGKLSSYMHTVANKKKNHPISHNL